MASRLWVPREQLAKERCPMHLQELYQTCAFAFLKKNVKGALNKAMN
jgi:hypothetical protein